MPSSSADAFSGDARINAAAGSLAGSAVVLLLLPLDTVKTHMQARGLSLVQSGRGLIREGGLRVLFRGAVPAVSECCMNRAMLFGAGAMVKKRLPRDWPEPVRDASAGSSAALVKTCLLHPVDTLKTRWQMGMRAPELLGTDAGLSRHFRRGKLFLGQLYQGFVPAALRSSVGMALWLVSRNGLERSFASSAPTPIAGPRPSPSSLASSAASSVVVALREGGLQHLAVGACSSGIVDLATFPFDTLKKRLQAAAPPSPERGAAPPRGLLREAALLYAEGQGIRRFYRGYAARFIMVAVNGAIFNWLFVTIKDSADAALSPGAPPKPLAATSLLR